MAKYEVLTLNARKIESLNKNVANCELQEVGGQVYPKEVSIWEDFPDYSHITFGSIVEGEIVVNSKGYASLKAPKAESGRKPNMDRLMNVKATNIAEAQSTKAQNIKAAQDRTAWMWAKNNAVEIAVHLGKSDDLMLINDLATKIYNMELLSPFND